MALPPRPIARPELLAVPSPVLPPAVEKSELLYDALADRGYPQLRVKRVGKDLHDYMEIFTLDELIRKALVLLSRA